MDRILIGIDPDVDKNGVAFIYKDVIDLLNLNFFELFDYLKIAKSKPKELLVVVEAGWLNKSNWHTNKKGSAALNAKIGNNTGRNHEVGRKIIEMLEYLGVQYKLVKPKTSKINSKMFHRITGIKKSNQEQRDSYMLIHGLK